MIVRLQTKERVVVGGKARNAEIVVGALAAALLLFELGGWAALNISESKESHSWEVPRNTRSCDVAEDFPAFAPFDRPGE